MNHTAQTSESFIDYREQDLRKDPHLYRVGKGDEGVLLVEPYKSEILPFWRVKTPRDARKSTQSILRLFLDYKKSEDFVGMDMARKFLQLGYTRSRRKTRQTTSRRYGFYHPASPILSDDLKAESARFFFEAWRRVEADSFYARLKSEWIKRWG